MPTTEHESPIELCRQHPELVPTLLRQIFHLTLPPFSSVRTEDPNTLQPVPDEYRADTAIILEDASPRAAVVTEIQRTTNPRKKYTWPLYTAALHARLECPTYLLVIALTQEVADWAGKVIATFQPGSRFAPLVVGPGQVPRFRTVEEARQAPRLAALGALLHGNEEAGEEVVVAAMAAAQEVDGERGWWWLYNLVRAILTDDRLKKLEEMIMLHEQRWVPRTDFERKHFGKGKEEGLAEGKAAGKAEAILAFLATRSIAVPEAIRQRIETCQDIDVLNRWIRRAATATTAEEVVAD